MYRGLSQHRTLSTISASTVHLLGNNAAAVVPMCQTMVAPGQPTGPEMCQSLKQHVYVSAVNCVQSGQRLEAAPGTASSTKVDCCVDRQ